MYCWLLYLVYTCLLRFDRLLGGRLRRSNILALWKKWISKNRKLSDIKIRWMYDSELPNVVDISRWCFENPWGEEEIIKRRRRARVLTIVAIRGRRVLGFSLFRQEKDLIDIESIAVAPHCRRQKAGSALLEYLTKKAEHLKIDIYIRVEASNKAARSLCTSKDFVSYDEDPDSTVLLTYFGPTVIDFTVNETSAVPT